MISGAWHRSATGVRQLLPATPGAALRRGILAAVLLAGLGLAHGTTLALVLHQAATFTQPGDRLVVAFAPGTAMPRALERLGDAGAVFSGTAVMPWLYRAEALDPDAAESLSSVAWVMRVPGKPTFAGCVAFITDERYRR